jgi:L-galactose dehydrogenase
MRFRPLGRTGLEVSVLGFGASPLGEEFGPIDAAEGERAVHAAIDAGINFFDTAPYYGRTLSETRLGQALRGRREQVILATKCGRYDVDHFDFSGSRIERSLEESLKRLQTDYLDVFHLHDIEFVDRRQILDHALPALFRIKESGKARFIGITGLQLGVLEAVARQSRVDVVLSYARYNLLLRDLDRSLRPFCEQTGIGLINASPLLLGALTQAGPPSWHPASKDALTACAKAAEASRAEGVDIARLALRFCLDHPYIASTLVGISSCSQLEANLQALDFEPAPALLRMVGSILEPFGAVWATGLAENHDASVSY